MTRYRGRVSGPLLDRVDLHVTVPPVSVDDLTGVEPGESSALVRKWVVQARRLQRERLAEAKGVYANGQMGASEIRRFCRSSKPVVRMLQRAMDRLDLSARAYHRILKVARTIADLGGRRRLKCPTSPRRSSTGRWIGGGAYSDKNRFRLFAADPSPRSSGAAGFLRGVDDDGLRPPC